MRKVDKVLSKICVKCGWKTPKIRLMRCNQCKGDLRRYEVIPTKPVFGD